MACGEVCFPMAEQLTPGSPKQLAESLNSGGLPIQGRPLASHRGILMWTSGSLAHVLLGYVDTATLYNRGPPVGLIWGNPGVAVLHKQSISQPVPMGIRT